MQTLLVFTTCPDEATAERIAQDIVGARLAACVNVLAPARAIYHWQGAVESTSEIPLLIKSTAAAYPALEARVRELHPYELPEIVAVPVERGLPDYLNWIAAETLQ